jgi:hypothetical protein
MVISIRFHEKCEEKMKRGVDKEKTIPYLPSYGYTKRT